MNKQDGHLPRTKHTQSTNHSWWEAGKIHITILVYPFSNSE